MLCCAGMDVDEEPAKADESAAGDKAEVKEGGEGKEGEGEGKEKPKEKEPSSYTLTAPCRVVPQQVKHVSFPPGEGRQPNCVVLSGALLVIACQQALQRLNPPG